MTRLLKNLNFQNGQVSHLDYELDFDLSIEEQDGTLREDLLQVQYPANYLLDFGWYCPPNSQDGVFMIYIIVHFDWNNPVKVWKSKSLEEAHDHLLTAIACASELTQSRADAGEGKAT